MILLNLNEHSLVNHGRVSKMFSIALLLFLVFKACLCVPPSPTDALLDDVNGIKISLKELAGIFDKWNSVYNNQIEPRMVSSSNTLAGIDSNVRNLQERAHVWDTFQLHISAWNDQLSSTDRKLDIISKAQEKLFNLDTKLNYISNLEYKLENVLKKLEETEESINTISRKIDEKKQGESLFGEFATRGILSTLKLIERKLDKIHSTGQNLMLKQNKNDEIRPRSVKCNNPPVVEEILHDVSSKVDVIFDKISEKDDLADNEDERSEDYFEDQQIGSGDTSDESKPDSDVRLLRKVLKRVNQPCKQTNKALDVIITKMKEMENGTAMMLRKNGRSCKGNALDQDKLLNNINQLGSNIQMSLNSHFSEQRAHFNSILKTNLVQNCLYKATDVPSHESNTTEPSTAVNTPVTIPVTSSDYDVDRPVHKSILVPKTSEEIEFVFNITSCEDLPFDAKSGVYNFTDAEDANLRYCHEGWTGMQRRDNYETLQNFSLSWSEYKYGFGDVGKDFWIGNEFLHRISSEKNLLLRVELEDFNGNKVWAQYDFFKVASERENYKLFVGGYVGNASDSLSSHSNSSFSTYDRKNDAAPSCCPCSLSYGGGWWFNSCFEANLNGVYHRNPNTNDYYRGIIWEHWLGNYSLKRTLMMVKPKSEIINGDDTENQSTTSIFYPFIEDP